MPPLVFNICWNPKEADRNIREARTAMSGQRANASSFHVIYTATNRKCGPDLRWIITPQMIWIRGGSYHFK